MPYLSPESLPSEICTITLQIPNDELLRLAVMGQVYELTHSHLWEQYGAVTPDQAASAMLTTYSTAQYCEPPVVPIPNAFEAQKTVFQTLDSNSSVLIPMTTVLRNAGGYYNPATSRFMPLVAGTYQIWVSLQMNGTAYRQMEVRKNGTVVKVNSFSASPATTTISALISIFSEIELDGVDDYLELWGSRFGSNVDISAGIGSIWGARLVYAVPAT